MMTAEEIETAAVRMIANGNGDWPVKEGHPLHGFCESVYIAFPLEDLMVVHVFLRRDMVTIREFKYELRRVNGQG